MLSPKQFIEHECENISNVINECLRHDYAGERSLKIFGECSERLSAIASNVTSCTNRDLAELKQLAYSLSRLSSLVTRVERSKLGEFSWPFSEQLEMIAAASCQGTTGADEYFSEPLFAISAEGGLDEYGIHNEQDQVDFANHRIFSIVFPRSLKHHVLFHAILGHEIGHAALTVPSMIKELSTNVIAVLEDGPFRNAETFQRWYEESGLGDMSSMVGDDIEDMLDCWVEECFCDLFGLLVLGPSFLAASYSLLSALDPQGLAPGDDHPPNVVRFDLLSKAVTYLGWNKPVKFWEGATASLPHLPSWASIFTLEQVASAITALQRILKPLGNALYKRTDLREVERLVRFIESAVPPTNVTLDSTGHIELRPLDFRSVLFGGWLYWYSKGNRALTFLQINLLCDQAILQQHAVDLWLAQPKDPE